MKRILAAAALLAASTVLGAMPSFGATIYHVSVDTSSLPSGTQADLDLQWNGGGLAGYSQTGTATISNFVNTGGSVVSAPSINPDATVTGALPGTVKFTVGSDGGMNIYYQTMQFGSRLDFDLTLVTGTPDCNDAHVSSCSMPGFTLDVYDSVAGSYLLTGDPTGSTYYDWALMEAMVQPDGTIQITTAPGPGGSASLVSVTAVPEPSMWFLLLAGFGTMGMMLRSRPRQVAA